MRAEVSFVLEQLDVILVGAGEDLPVDRARVVTRGIGAVVEVLDGEAVIGAAVPAGEEALHHLAGHQLHVPHPRQAVRIEVSLTHG